MARTAEMAGLLEAPDENFPRLESRVERAAYLAEWYGNLLRGYSEQNKVTKTLGAWPTIVDQFTDPKKVWWLAVDIETGRSIGEIVKEKGSEVIIEEYPAVKKRRGFSRTEYSKITLAQKITLNIAAGLKDLGFEGRQAPAWRRNLVLIESRRS